MPTHDSTADKLQKAGRSAQMACLFFGLALLIWGLAPAVVVRLATGRPPTWGAFAMGSVTVLMGLCLIGLGMLIGRGAVWALWTALSISLVILLGTIILALAGGAGVQSAYPMLLAACTAGTSWLALDWRRRSERENSAPGAT